jgi:hypothetical protein
VRCTITVERVSTTFHKFIDAVERINASEMIYFFQRRYKDDKYYSCTILTPSAGVGVDSEVVKFWRNLYDVLSTGNGFNR